jgi:hypothetical protein
MRQQLPRVLKFVVPAIEHPLRLRLLLILWTARLPHVLREPFVKASFIMLHQ